MALVKTKMELGFVEKVDDPSQLCSSLFPSKVGGKPAWLDPQDLPPPESVSCKRCRSPLTFLLQVYAPLSDGERDETFHRSISIFMCRDSICHQQDGPKCFQVLRCQLRKVNNFYSESADSTVDTADQLDRLKLDKVDDPQDDDTDDKPSISATEMTVQDIEGWDEEVKSKPASTSSVSVEGTLTVCRRTSPLCIVCGMSGPKSCAKCKRVSYCSKEHQTHDWKNGHKLFCPDLAKGNNCIVDYDPSVGVTLPLFEIVTEPEPENASPDGRAEKSVEERMADYHSIVKTKNLSVSRLKKEESVREKKSDKQFKVFKKRVALEPEQVIRYHRDSCPLLVSNEGVPTEGEIPNCVCGAKRVFELQVMPQLLYYLKLDEVMGPSVDWGTLLVYTCSESCSTGPAYKEEFLWRQHFTQ